MSTDTSGPDKAGAIAVAAGAAVWGLFWIPLRLIEQAGLEGLVVVAIANATAALAMFIYLRWHEDARLISSLHDMLSPQAMVLGCTLGASSVMYMLALLYTDVIRAVFLFYLLPVWAVLATRFLFQEPIRLEQMLAIGLTVIGVWLLLGGDADHLQVRPGFGDLMAILAGMTWGLGLALLGGQDTQQPARGALHTFVAATLFATACLLVLHLGSTFGASFVSAAGVDIAPPQQGIDTQLTGLLPAVLLTVAFGVFLLMPSVLSQVWGADRLPASVAAIVTTTEILVASVSAILLIGTAVDGIGALGAVLIAIAIGLSLRQQRVST